MFGAGHHIPDLRWSAATTEHSGSLVIDPS
jgi:hypothetical protein